MEKKSKVFVFQFNILVLVQYGRKKNEKIDEANMDTEQRI